MATARVTELKAMVVNDIAAKKDWTIPVSNLDVAITKVDMLSNEMMVGKYDTLPGRGGKRKIEGSFDTHLFGAQGVTAATTLKTAASIGTKMPLLCLLQAGGYKVSVNATGESFGCVLSDNPNADAVPTKFIFWQGDLRSQSGFVNTNPTFNIKGGEYIVINWDFLGQFTGDPVQDTSYPTYPFGATQLAGMNGTFALSFLKEDGTTALTSYGSAITSDVMEVMLKSNNTLAMNADITESWGYSEPVIVAPRKSEVTIKTRIPYSIGISGTNLWYMFQNDQQGTSAPVSPQADPAIGKITYKVAGVGAFNTFEFVAYFKMTEYPVPVSEEGVMYTNIVGQIYPYTVGGTTTRPFYIKVYR